MMKGSLSNLLLIVLFVGAQSLRVFHSATRVSRSRPSSSSRLLLGFDDIIDDDGDLLEQLRLQLQMSNEQMQRSKYVRSLRCHE